MAELSSSELDPESQLSSTLNGSGAAPTARRTGTGRRLQTKQSRAESTGLLTWRTGVIFSPAREGKHDASAERKTRIVKVMLDDVTRGDSQRRFLAQHSVAMLEQCCTHSKQCCNNVATLCCAKNRRCKSSRVTSPLCNKGDNKTQAKEVY